MVELGELVEVRSASPAGILEGLGQLTAVDVALGLDDDDPGLLVEGDHGGLTDREPRSTGDPE